MTEVRDQGKANPETKRKRKLAMLTLGSIFLFLGFIWLIYWLIWGRFHIYTDDAYVNGNMVQLMSQVPGTVIEISTDDTYLVEKGQAIIKLDPADMQIALEKARANLAQTVRLVKQDFEQAEQAQALLILRHADLMKAQADLKRRTGLIGEKAISREELQHYQTTVTTTQAQYNDALHHLRAILALVENSHLYTHPLVETAKANFRKAYLDSARTTILAPVTGYVAKRSVQVGQEIASHTPLLAIIPLDNVWVDANYKESQLSPLRIGQPVTLYADAYDNITYHGKVVGLNAGTGASFALLPPQNATGNWIKIVQRLPVRISLDTEELKKAPLQLGLSMRVTVDTHHKQGQRLAAIAEQKPLYVTDIYAKQLDHANQEIEAILKNNAADSYVPVSQQDVT